MRFQRQMKSANLIFVQGHGREPMRLADFVFYLNTLWKGACDEGFSRVQQQNFKRGQFCADEGKKVASRRPYTTKRNNDKKMV